MDESPLVMDEPHDTGGSVVMGFGIVPGRERGAGAELLAHLRRGAEVMLRNDLDEGHEGCTFFRRVRWGYETKTGGHGWQSGWGPTDEAGVLAAVAELADLNRGHNERDRGAVRRDKMG